MNVYQCPTTTGKLHKLALLETLKRMNSSFNEMQSRSLKELLKKQ